MKKNVKRSIQSKWHTQAIALVILFILPVVSFAQDDSPSAPGPQGGSPDQNHTLAVPFDSNMNFMFLLIAVFFAAIVIRKIQAKKLKGKSAKA
ncbi:hypothetical protein [Ferruginibacter albus]|uniref:hypothetical protein n=1 Tax=Ferruginibacter albus TaxID=2875540 RepID=UPI001CC7FEB8|nr:hypothetical protein [Ferruginibacter albus]UAY51601.1 hypothetical protein K9M53_13520 [Ferruginibacter albus]